MLIRGCLSMYAFADHLFDVLNITVSAAGSGGLVLAVDLIDSVEGYPGALFRLIGASNDESDTMLLLAMKTPGFTLTLSELQLECPGSLWWQVLKSEEDFWVVQITDYLVPQLASALSGAFSTDVTAESTSRTTVGDGAIHSWVFTVGDPAYRFLSLHLRVYPSSDPVYHNPLHGGVASNVQQSDDGWYAWRQTAESDDFYPYTAPGSSGTGGGGSDVDLTPVVEKLDAIKGAIDDISLNASVNHGQFEVSLRGADGAGDGGD